MALIVALGVISTSPVLAFEPKLRSSSVNSNLNTQIEVYSSDGFDKVDINVSTVTSSGDFEPYQSYGFNLAIFNAKIFYTHGPTNNIFTLDTLTNIVEQIELNGVSFPTTFKPAAAASKEHIFIHGGDVSGTQVNNLFRLDPSNNTVVEIIQQGDVPGPRNAHTMVFFEDQMIIFGGYDGQNYLDQVRVLKIQQEAWFNPPTTGRGPSERYTAVTAVINSTMYLHGGQYRGTKYSDFFSLNLQTWVWTELTFTASLPQTTRHAMIPCSFQGADGTTDSHALLLVKNEEVYAAQLKDWSFVKVADLGYTNYGSTRAVVVDNKTVYVFTSETKTPVRVSKLAFASQEEPPTEVIPENSHELPMFLSHEQILIGFIFLTAVVIIVIQFGGGLP